MLRERPMLAAAAALAGGLLLARYVNIPRLALLLLIAAGAAALLFIYRERLTRMAALCVICAVLAMVGIILYDNSTYTPPAPNGDVELTGYVVNVERIDSGACNYVLSRVLVRVSGGEWQHLPGQVLVYGLFRRDAALPGQTLILPQAVVSSPSGPRNPGEKDARFNLWGRGVRYSANAYGVTYVRGTPNMLATTMFKIREAVREKIIALFPGGEERALVLALLIGETSLIDDDTRESFSQLGIAHVLAVSGLHVGFILLLLNGMLKGLMYAVPRRYVFLWARLRYARCVAVCLALVAYDAILGFSPSITRAVVMAAVSMTSRAVGVRRDNGNTLGTAALIVLLIQPMDLFTASMQLSFGAVAGIFLFANSIQNLLLRVRLHKVFADSMSVTFAAQVGTLPLLALYFGRLPLLGLFANLFAVPLAGVTVMTAVPVVAVGFISKIAYILAYIPAMCARLLTRMAHGAAWFPAMYVDIAHPPMPVIAAYFAVTLLLAPKIIRHNSLVWRVFVAGFAVLLFASVCVWGMEAKPANLQATVLDAGMGQAMILRYGGTMVLIDGGASRSRPLDAARMYGRGYDAVVLTGREDSRVGAVHGLINEGAVGALYVPPNMLDTDAKAAMHAAIELAGSMGVPVIAFRPGTAIDIGEIHIESVMPVGGKNLPGVYTVSVGEGETQILFTGNLSVKGEDEYEFPGARMLLAANKGSEDSCSERLLSQVMPEIAVMPVSRVSGGENGARTLARLYEYVPWVERTDYSGAVTVTFGENIKVKRWAGE